MSNLSVEQRTYYLPNNFVYQDTTTQSNPVLEVYNDAPGLPRNNIPGVPRDITFFDSDINNDFNGQSAIGGKASVKDTNVFTAQINPPIIAETGYSLFLSPAKLNIPTSFYNLYEIQNGLTPQQSLGNNYMYIMIISSNQGEVGANPLEEVYQAVPLTQGNYTPIELGKEVTRVITELQNFYNDITTDKGLVRNSIDGSFKVVYKESSRKFKFENNLTYINSDPPPNPLVSWEVRFFMNDIISFRSNNPLEIPTNICLSPLGLTIPSNQNNLYIIPNVIGYTDDAYNLLFPSIPFEPGLSMSYWKIGDNINRNGNMWSMKNIDLRRSPTIFLICDFSTSSSTGTFTNEDNDRILCDIEIPYISGADERLPSNISFDPQDSAFKTIARIPGSTTLSTINYQLVDSKGVSLDMNGVNWSLTTIISQQPHNNEGVAILEESMKSFLAGIPEFDRSNVDNLKNITQALNPEKLLDFKKRMKKLKGKVSFDSILNNLQGEKSRIYQINPETGKKKDIPDITKEDIGAENKPGYYEEKLKENNDNTN